MKPTSRYSFLLFHSHNPPKKFIYRMACSRAKTRSTRSQICMKYGGFYYFYSEKFRCQHRWSKNTSQKKLQNKVDFPDVIINFSKMVCVLPSTLWRTGDMWHQDIRVTHCQSSAKNFIFTQYSFCNSFRHALLRHCIVKSVEYVQVKNRAIQQTKGMVGFGWFWLVFDQIDQ